jgi:hypothetical protein
MHVNPKIKLRKRRARKTRFAVGPQTKLRTDRKLPVLYYIYFVRYIRVRISHTNHHSKKIGPGGTEVHHTLRLLKFRIRSLHALLWYKKPP